MANVRAVGRVAEQRLRAAVLGVRRRGRSAALRAARLAGAAVAALLVAEALGLQDPPPLIAALMALLVVQATASSMLINGVQHVLSVVAGVLLAVGFVSVVALSWWSLGLLVAASIVVGQLLRLRPHLVEMPISAMLVLGVGYPRAATSTGYSRGIETVIGAVVGVLVNLAFPPKVRSRYAGQAVQRLAEEIVAVLDDAAEGLGAGAGAAAVRATHLGNWFPAPGLCSMAPSSPRSRPSPAGGLRPALTPAPGGAP